MRRITSYVRVRKFIRPCQRTGRLSESETNRPLRGRSGAGAGRFSRRSGHEATASARASRGRADAKIAMRDGENARGGIYAKYFICRTSASETSRRRPRNPAKSRGGGRLRERMQPREYNCTHIHVGAPCTPHGFHGETIRLRGLLARELRERSGERARPGRGRERSGDCSRNADTLLDAAPGENIRGFKHALLHVLKNVCRSKWSYI